MSTVATAFARATAVEPDGEGAWRATAGAAWTTGIGLNGGYLAAIVLRAMAAELDDPARQPRSLTCHYLRPPAVGDLRVEVAIERSGRTLSTLSARVIQDRRLCILALAAFAREFDSLLDYAPAPPAMTDLETVPLMPPPPEVPVVANFQVRPTLGGMPFASAPEAVTGGWLRFAEPHPLDAPALAMYADGWLPSPMVRLDRRASAPTLDLTVHFRAPEAAAAVVEEPAFVVFHSTMSAGGFYEEDGEIWSGDGVLLAQSRQLALLQGDTAR